MAREMRGRLIITALLLASRSILGAFIQPFSLDEVQLHEGSMFQRAMALNTEYMLSLEVDDLLLTFRQNAGLPAPGRPYLGSWEDPTCEVRGQFTGHYLSALAMLGNHTGQEEVLARSTLMVEELKKVRDALGGGYLSAFPLEHFQRLRNLVAVWAPFYVIHKVMAGLLDQYIFLGNPTALQMVQDEATFFLRYIDDVIAFNGTAHWYSMLNNEFGGMNEVLINLYDITHNLEHLRAANMFIKPVFWEPLLQLRDPLAGIHANTHLAQVNGFAAKYDKVGDASSFKAVRYFFDILTGGHSFTSGGSNLHEYWGPPLKMADAILLQEHATETQETCTQYNVLKIARYLFRWTGEASFADFYERAILNGLLGTQRMPDKPHHALPSRSPPSSAVVGSAAWARRSPPRPHVIDIDPYTEDWRRAAFALFPGGPQGTDGDRSTALLGDRPLGTDYGTLQDTNDPGPGVLLYLLPQGSGQNKGQSTHGWGYPLRSFWCCYGTSVESFVKLADSIFFHRLPAPGDVGSPTVYINQWVPATLTSRQLGVSIKMEADLYTSDFVVTANLSLGLASPGPLDLSLALRIPSWASGARVSLNGKLWKSCTGNDGGLKHWNRTHDLRAVEEFDNPLPGTFCVLKTSFNQGDVVTVELPMTVYAETVQDDRPQFAKFKSVMVGPHVMAALTPDNRTIAADPAAVAGLVSSIVTPSASLLVTLSASVSDAEAARSPERDNDQDSWRRMLWHDGRKLRVGALRVGSKMAATFKAALLNASDSEPSNLKGLPRAFGHGDVVTLESLDMPGFFVGADDAGGELVLRNLHDASISNKARTAFRTAFRLVQCCPARTPTHLPSEEEAVEEADREEGTRDFCLMLLAGETAVGAGHMVDVWSGDRSDHAGDRSAHPGDRSNHAGDRANDVEEEGLQVGVSKSVGVPTLGHMQDSQTGVEVPSGGAGEGPAGCGSRLRVRFGPPVGGYPAGAKLLTGRDRKYIIAPLSRIVEESYSTYLEWTGGPELLR